MIATLKTLSARPVSLPANLPQPPHPALPRSIPTGLGTPSILALDMGSRCGWAIGKEGDVCSGVWDIAPRRGESPGMRYIRLRARLQEVRTAYPDLAAVFYEQAHHRGGAATEYAVGCVATVQAWCAEHGIEHSAVHSATIKKHATGKGNAGKGEVIAAMRAAGFKPSDDNEADALALLAWALDQGGVQ